MMKVTIKIIYTSDGTTKIMQRASFPVNTKYFKDDPDQEAARVAFDWWKHIKRNMFHRVLINEIFYNENHDITKLVKELDKTPIPDDNFILEALLER